jgi:hypothetical protein
LIFRSQLAPLESRGAVSPAFDAISETQQKATVSDWFVTQPDHARISGELAAALDPSLVPNLSEAVVRAIGMHDIGWMPYDGDAGSPQAPRALDSGVAVSFVNSEPETFLPAWMGSIQAAQSTGALGGLIVSAHFQRLTTPYLESGKGTPEQRSQVERFLHRERARVDRLLPQAGLRPGEIEALIQVLQFCDLASLYWCANPQAPVELPQRLSGRQVQFSCESGSFHMTPSLLKEALALEIPCVRFVDGKAEWEMVRLRVE